MPRRVVLLLSLLALALLGTAVAPWTLPSGGLAASVGRQFRDNYGLELSVAGRSTFALLPVPRIKFEGISLASDDGLAVEQGVLRGELRLLPLLLGRVELAEAALSEARVVLRGEGAKLDPDMWLAALKRVASDKGSIRRLILTNSAVEGSRGTLENVNLVLSWPARTGPLQAAGEVSWRGERISIADATITPSILASGRPAPFTVDISAPAGRAKVVGEAQVGPDPRITGHSNVQIRSVRDLSRWSGLDLPLGSLIQAAAIEGDFSADRRRLSWPSVAATLGDDRMEGTLAIRFDNGRPVVTGTLAAERVDLSNFFSPFTQARTSSGLWSGEDASVLAATGGDLDLRLSATNARIGRLRLGDMAASVIVRPGRIEASLGRASLNKGTLKGRLSLVAVSHGTDLKAQGTFENVDAAGFLNDIGQGRWLAGLAQGHFMLETSGGTVADLVRQSHGRTTINVKQGEVIGVSLHEALKRVEKRPLAASLDWKGGRTPFDLIHVVLNVGAGVGEIVEGALTAPGLRTSLQGSVSLMDRLIAVRASVDPAPASTLPAPVFVFDVTGGWDDVAVVPDARSLIERSGAAKPLFGKERLVPAIQPTAPVATAH
jgi:AsmA protein